MAKAPTPEWIVTDNASLKRALDAMRSQRKLNWEGVFSRVGIRNIYNFVIGKQDNLHSGSIFKFVNGLEYELVIRPISKPKLQRRLDLLREEHAQAKQAIAQAKEAAEFEAEGRDETGRLRVLTEAQRAEADALLDRYAQY